MNKYAWRDYLAGMVAAAFFVWIPELLVLVASGILDEPFIRRLLRLHKRGWVAR